MVEGGSENDENSCCKNSGSEVGNCSCASEESGEERPPAGEDGREANEDCEAGCCQSCAIENEHGFGSSVVGIEPSCQRIGKEGIDVDAGRIQAPDLDGVEPEVGCRVGTVGVLVVAIPAAVVA